MATISLRLSEYEDNLIKNYAALRKMNISELIRQAVLERIEDEYDLQLYEKAMRKYNKNSKTYTLNEIEQELALDDLSHWVYWIC